ncbi:MAG: hypothetical protein E7589_07905 [Ruminococcaceae bacterium]|nr:hypothetical protein [Oscillospiraceae bacterium]
MIITFCGHADFIPRQEDEQKILSILENTVGNSPAELLFGGYGILIALRSPAVKSTNHSTMT